MATAPAGLRETLDGLTATALVARCKSFRPGRLKDPTVAAKYALRSLACRYLQLDKEIRDLQAELARLTLMADPALVSIFGVGTDTSATLLISAGSNPQRIHSEAAFASLCGVSPMPASSGKTNRKHTSYSLVWSSPPGPGLADSPAHQCQAIPDGLHPAGEVFSPLSGHWHARGYWSRVVAGTMPFPRLTRRSSAHVRHKVTAQIGLACFPVLICTMPVFDSIY